MKIHRRLFAMLLTLCLAALPLGLSRADAAGVLSENELNTWLSQVLRDSAEEQPSNAPVGEESLTEDGYAFIYSFATLYYDKPELDEHSVLCAVSLTDERYPAPRGICLGSGASALMDSFGWQNPLLMGDGLFAALYQLNELPRAAYWSLAQMENGALRAVQCAVHVTTGGGMYTDAGMQFTLDNGRVSAIRAYGLNKRIPEADVTGNLQTLLSVQSAISGDEQEPPAATSFTTAYEGKAFCADDLRFGGIDALRLTETGAKAKFGESLETQSAQDDTSAWLKTYRRDGLTLSYQESADGKTVALETLSLTKDLMECPRGLRIGVSTLDQALRAFGTDGLGKTADSAAILYGDGVTAPTALMEPSETGGVTLRYLTDAPTLTAPVTLSLSFTNDVLTELLLYTW